MPGPAIYIVAAIGTVVVVAAFKEFVYDPHLRPKVEAWQETMREQRRQSRLRRQGVLNPPVSSDNHNGEDSSDEDDDGNPFSDPPGRWPPSPGTDSAYSDPPIPLQDLVSREVDEWRSGVDIGRDPSGLRIRRGQPPSSQGTVRPNYMDQNDPATLSTPTLRPTYEAERPNVLFNYTNSPPEPTSPTSTLNSDFLSDSAFSSPRSQEFHLGVGTPHATTTTPLPGAPTVDAPIVVHTPISPRVPGTFTESPGTTRSSTPDTDILATSVIPSVYDYFTPGTASESRTPSAGRSRASSPDFVVRSADESPEPLSPFSDMRVPNTRTPSPLILDEFLSPPTTAEDLPSDVEFNGSSSDDEMYSLPSHVQSGVETDSMPDDEFDTVSEASSWAGIHGFAADARR